jgi:hypothetical protein
LDGGIQSREQVFIGEVFIFDLESGSDKLVGINVEVNSDGPIALPVLIGNLTNSPTSCHTMLRHFIVEPEPVRSDTGGRPQKSEKKSNAVWQTASNLPPLNPKTGDRAASSNVTSASFVT